MSAGWQTMKPTDSRQDDNTPAPRPARPLQQALDMAAVLMVEHGNRTPRAPLGGSTKSMNGMLIAPSAPPKPDFDTDTAITDRIHMTAK